MNIHDVYGKHESAKQATPAPPAQMGMAKPDFSDVSEQIRF